tara:strand:+ start:295 stop:1230 length:936 start_codon:yes stop_codon:yes gene_type:complete
MDKETGQPSSVTNKTATKPKFTEAEKEALLLERTQTEETDLQRILLGTSADITQSLFGVAASQIKFADDPNLKNRYRQLKRGDADAEQARQDQVEAVTSATRARIDKAMRELPAKVDSVDAASILQQVSSLEDQATATNLKAQRAADTDRAREKVREAEEMAAIRKEMADRKTNRKLGKLKGISDITSSVLKGAAAVKPRTTERKLEDKTRRLAKRQERLSTRIGEMGEEESLPSGLFGTKQDKGDLQAKLTRLGEKESVAKSQLEALRSAKEKQRQAKLAMQAPTFVFDPTGLTRIIGGETKTTKTTEGT